VTFTDPEVGSVGLTEAAARAAGLADKLWYLRRLNLFEGMREEEVEAVSRELRMRTCEPGAPFRTREQDRVYLLKSGRMRLYQLTADGHEITTAVLEPGQLFGLSSLMGGDGCATHAEPLEEAVVCEASAPDFVGLLARHPLLMAKVLMVMARQMFRLEQTIEGLASQPVSSRLAGLLLTRLEDGKRLDGGVLLPPMTHDELASIIDSSRESVSRTIGRWRGQGIVGARGRRIVVLAPDRLRGEAEARR
jgi:CRP/FNR family transcriptional regulator, cyclic AMP receptor protein